MRAKLDAGIRLGGILWKPLRAVTFDLQNRRVDVVRRSGVTPLFPTFDVVAGDPSELAAEVLQVAFASGVLYEMLAHLLVEDGAEYLPWSPAKADERAHLFATLIDPADHQRLADNVLWLVLDFFLSASASSETFLRSLVSPARSARVSSINSSSSAPARSRRLNTPGATESSASAATSTSDAGTPSSAPSPGSEASIP